MRKITFLLSAVLMLTLCSCEDSSSTTGTTSNGDISSSTTSSTTTSSSGDGWSSKDEQLMKDKLDGYVLPYYDFGNYSFKYDTERGCIYLEIDGYNPSNDHLVSDYMTILRNDGYFSEVNEADYPYYSANKVVSETNFIDLEIYNANEEYYEITKFGLDVWANTMTQDWPTQDIVKYMSLDNADELIPVFESEHYIYVDDYVTSGGVRIRIPGYSNIENSIEVYCDQLSEYGYSINWNDYAEFEVVWATYKVNDEPAIELLMQIVSDQFQIYFFDGESFA